MPFLFHSSTDMITSSSPLYVLSVILSLSQSILAYTPIVVKNVTNLGPQISPGVSGLSRDGGYSVLINGNIVWLYDDTECLDAKASQLSFISNTAATCDSPRSNITRLKEYGVVNVGKELDGSPKNAILAGTAVGAGGWVPFQPDELEFNQQMSGKERVAIWPGAPPTPISTQQAFLYAPLVYVDYNPQDPSKEYQGRGMTLISITAPSSGPVALRQGDLIIPGTEIGFGGFAAVMGRKSLSSGQADNDGARDLYLFGVTPAGLQLARVDINDLSTFSLFSFWSPKDRKFVPTSPRPGQIDNTAIYMPGSFSSGTIFYSPYFSTFMMLYFNNKGDSTFYMRYLDLSTPITNVSDSGRGGSIWQAGGKGGHGIDPEDAEALLYYAWSEEQKLYTSPADKGGYNYAGTCHPEFFNTQYFAPSLYPANIPASNRRNEWYGSDFVTQEKAGTDGRFLLISWTSQKNKGVYEVRLAVIEFGDIPIGPGYPAKQKGAGPTSTSKQATATKDPNVESGTITMPTDSKGAARFIVHWMETGKLANAGSEVSPRLGIWLLAIGTLGFLLRWLR